MSCASIALDLSRPILRSAFDNEVTTEYRNEAIRYDMPFRPMPAVSRACKDVFFFGNANPLLVLVHGSGFGDH
jgi:hypothetical protein